MSIVLGAGLPAGADNNGNAGPGANPNAASAGSSNEINVNGNGALGPAGNPSAGDAGGNPGNANANPGNANGSPGNSNGSLGHSNGNPGNPDRGSNQPQSAIGHSAGTNAGGGPATPARNAGGSSGRSSTSSLTTASSDSRVQTSGASSGPAADPANGGGGSNTNNANSGCGAYCANPGDLSRNGNGGDKATGRPDAGTVGKADNKNPRGQRPNGRDRNNGYECDGNHGIARGNPAHTICPPPPPPPGGGGGGGGGNPPDGTSAVNPAAGVESLVTTRPVGLTGSPSPPRLAVLGVTLERPTPASAAPSTAAVGAPRAPVLGITVEGGTAGALARTGVNTLDMGTLGLGLILGGAALARVNRRRPTTV